jgi:DNA helicase-2/ATP-dependent DNA helicase PcrA
MTQSIKLLFCSAYVVREKLKKASDFSKSNSKNSQITEHDGLFLLSIKNLGKYLEKYNPVQLRDSIKTKVNEEYLVLNYGKPKGLTRKRVVIYPSGPMVKWLVNHETEISRAARAKLYVALTRAKHSVVIVLKDKDIKKISNLPVYTFD